MNTYTCTRMSDTELTKCEFANYKNVRCFNCKNNVLDISKQTVSILKLNSSRPDLDGYSYAFRYNITSGDDTYTINNEVDNSQSIDDINSEKKEITVHVDTSSIAKVHNTNNNKQTTIRRNVHFNNQYAIVYYTKPGLINDIYMVKNDCNILNNIFNNQENTFNNYISIDKTNGKILERKTNSSEIDEYFENIILDEKTIKANTRRAVNQDGIYSSAAKILSFALRTQEEFLFISSKLSSENYKNIRLLDTDYFGDFFNHSASKGDFLDYFKQKVDFENEDDYLITTINEVRHAGFTVLTRDDVYIFDSSHHFFRDKNFFSNEQLFKNKDIFTNSYMEPLQIHGNCGFWATHGIEHYSKISDLTDLLASKNKTRYIDVENIQIACKMSDLFDTKRIGEPLLTENVSTMSDKNDYINILLPYFKSDAKNSEVYCKNVFVRKGFDDEDNYKFSDCINTFSLDKTLLTIGKDFTKQRLFNTNHSDFNSTALDATIARNGLKANSMTTKSDIEAGIIYSYQKKAKTTPPLILNQTQINDNNDKAGYDKFTKDNCEKGFELFRNITAKICTIFIKNCNAIANVNKTDDIIDLEQFKEDLKNDGFKHSGSITGYEL